MPKGIGYAEAGKTSKMMGKGKSKKDANKNLKKQINPRTEKIIKGMIRMGLSRKEAEARVDKQRSK
jgi:hypothetical protein